MRVEHHGVAFRSFAAMIIAWWPAVGPLGVAAVAKNRDCAHCQLGEAFSRFLKDYDARDSTKAHSTVHYLWPTHVEIVPTTKDIGGWEDPSLHTELAKVAIQGYEEFVQKIAPELPENHHIRKEAEEMDSDDHDALFFAWQRALFHAGGDVERAKLGNRDSEEEGQPSVTADTTWPEMQRLPQYARVRKVVDKLSRRYLERSGLANEAAEALNYSIFNWATVHRPGQYRSMRPFTGQYHVALFYAKAGPGSGKLRLQDPRGHSPPYGREFLHAPRSGDLIIFPSWLGHMMTVSPSVSKDQSETVVFTFNIHPAEGPLACEEWWTDPLADLRFTRLDKIDKEITKLR